MATILLPRVDGCPAGGVFYVCNGFRGCCTIDPCMPGSTCPVEKDLTPGRPSGPISSALASSTVSPIALTNSPSSMITSTRHATATSQPLPSSLVETSYRTVTAKVSEAAPTSAATPSTSSSVHSTPVAGIVGGVLGFIIFCALWSAIFYFIRKSRLARVYKTPEYPSPWVGTDMTPQLSSKASTQLQQKVAALYRADSTDQFEPSQLDSREILHEHCHRDSAGHFAELPAEPLPWPGYPTQR